MTLSLSRRHLIGGIAAIGTGALVSRMVRAQSETPSTPDVQPLSYRRQVGDFTVTTLLDGYFLLGQELITDLPATEMAASLAAASLDVGAAVPLPIAGYLIESGDALTLIDAGAGSTLGGTAGNLASTLAGLGRGPDQIGRIAVTHLHPDHIGGLLVDGVPVFANATLLVNQTEMAFWTDQANRSRLPEAVSSWFDLAASVLEAYGDRIEVFADDGDLGNGLSAVHLPGHTPGHSGFRLDGGREQVLMWGDSTSVASLQFSHPQTGIVFDTDARQAEDTRRRLLDMVATDRILVAGTHLPFPGVGQVERTGDAYRWQPEEWRFF